MRELLSAFRKDVEAQRARPAKIASVAFPQLTACALYRLAHCLRKKRAPEIASAVGALGQLLTGAEISPEAELAGGFCLAHTGGVVVGPGVRTLGPVLVASGVTLGSTGYDSRSGRPAGWPTLCGHNVVYTNASVLGLVEIGRGAIVGAHALVLDSVPAGFCAKGVPARSSAIT